MLAMGYSKACHPTEPIVKTGANSMSVDIVCHEILDSRGKMAKRKVKLTISSNKAKTASTEVLIFILNVFF